MNMTSEAVQVETQKAVRLISQFISEMEDWAGPDAHVRTTGEYGSDVRISLNTRHLKLAMTRLQDLESAISEISGVVSHL